MQVAIETATVIASVLTARLKNSELSFFNHRRVMPPISPKNAMDVLKVASTITADHATAPAACLWPYLVNKKKVDLFILATDEEEK